MLAGMRYAYRQMQKYQISFASGLLIDNFLRKELYKGGVRGVSSLISCQQSPLRYLERNVSEDRTPAKAG